MDERPNKSRGPLLWLAGRSRRFWVGAMVMMPLLYVGSFGPACWLTAWPNPPYFSFAHNVGPQPQRWMMIYFPLGAVIVHAYGTPAARTLNWWATYGMQPGYCGIVPFSVDGGWQTVCPDRPHR
jgi:hypothetical protein